jgi:ribose 5-phosphate isomerase B
MIIALASDHGGFELKESIKLYLQKNNIEFNDYGTYSADSVDYTDMVVKPCEDIRNGKAALGVFCCGTGIGISMAANKLKGIRAACCSDYYSAKYTRLHNDANVLCLGGRVMGAGLAEELVEVFISTEFVGGRHKTRVDKLNAMDD